MAQRLQEIREKFNQNQKECSKVMKDFNESLQKDMEEFENETNS